MRLDKFGQFLINYETCLEYRLLHFIVNGSKSRYEDICCFRPDYFESDSVQTSQRLVYEIQYH